MRIEEKTGNFGFGGRGHDVTEDFADGMDGAVERRLAYGGLGGICGDVAEKEMATGATFSFGFRKVGCVAV